jgi:hypothetical protein
MPPIGLAVVLMADRLGFLPPNNKMFQFVLLLQQSMPTSILAGKIYTHASIYLFLCYLFNLCSELG